MVSECQPQIDPWLNSCLNVPSSEPPFHVTGKSTNSAPKDVEVDLNLPPTTVVSNISIWKRTSTRHTMALASPFNQIVSEARPDLGSSKYYLEPGSSRRPHE